MWGTVPVEIVRGLSKPIVFVLFLAIALLAASALWTPSGAFGQSGNSLSVTGLGTTGNEQLRVRVDGAVVSTLDLTTQSTTHTATLPEGTTWGQIELAFVDGPGMDVTLTGFRLGGESRSMIAGDVLVSGQWVGTCSSLSAPSGSTIHCNGVVQFPAASGAGGGSSPVAQSTLDRSYFGNSQTVVPVYDTAWDMGVQVTLAEGREYLDFVQDAGFSGFATTYLGAIHRPAARTDQEPVFTRKDPLGNPIATWDDATGNLIMDPGHADHFEDLLDEAHARGLRVMLLVFWERKSVEEYGLINEGNAYNWAHQIGSRFRDHPAIQTWTLGGDAGVDDARTQLWTNAVQGLRDAGVTGDINFHTGSAPARRVNQVNAEWNSAQLVQTSHCADTELAASRIQGVMAQTDTPVWVGESRYEGIDATWCNPRVPIPTADDIVADAEAFLDAGVAGIIYGHNERWQWGHGLEGSSGRGFDSVRESFSAPGAFELIERLTVDDPSPPTTEAPVDPPTTQPTTTEPPTTEPPTTNPGPASGNALAITGRGTTGNELLQVRVNGFTHDTVSLTRASSTQFADLPDGTSWEDIELFFGDGPSMDVILDGFELGGESRSMVAGDVLVSGQWTRATGCTSLGEPLFNTIHCVGTVQFPATTSPTAPTTGPTAPTTPPTTPTPPPTSEVPPATEPPVDAGDESVVFEVTARGTTGNELLQVRLNGFTNQTVDLSVSSQTHTVSLPVGTSWDDIEVFFADGPLMDVVFTSFALHGDMRTMAAGDVLASGQWVNGSGCSSLGDPVHSTLHCRGVVQFPAARDVGIPTTPTTPTTSPTTPTDPVGGDTLAITGRGTTGNELVQVRVNGFTRDTIEFSRETSTQIATLPDGTTYDEIELFFGDGPLMDVILEGFELGGESRTMTQGDVLASGQWVNGSGCSGLGDPVHSTIHCRGVVQFP